ncbi:hypothetical protein [Treponema sp. R80B11-R83G3]
MKNKSNVPLVQLIGIIAIAAVIGFSMAACGGDDDDNGGKKDNGVTWKAVTNTTFGTGKIQAIAWGGAAGQEKFVAGSDDGKMAYSSDGITWTTVADSKLGYIEAITYGNGKFVAVGYSKIAYSSDGVTWTAVTTASSANAIAWGGAAGQEKFVAGEDGSIAYSSDGVTWTRVFVNDIFGNVNNNILGIAYSDDYWGAGTAKFVAVGYLGKMAYSSDGVTWTAVADTKFGRNISGIAWGFLRFVAVGQDKVAESTDGIIWIDRLGDIPMDNTIGGGSAITYGNGKFVAVGSNGKAAYLSDPDENGAGGNYWTAIANTTFNTSNSIATKSQILGIAYGNGKFVAVGCNYDGGSFLPHIAYWDDN